MITNKKLSYGMKGFLIGLVLSMVLSLIFIIWLYNYKEVVNFGECDIVLNGVRNCEDIYRNLTESEILNILNKMFPLGIIIILVPTAIGFIVGKYKKAKV